MNISLHPGAGKDIEEAAEFYRREGSPALAAKFVLISHKPQLSIPVRPERSAVGAKSKGPEGCFDFVRYASYAQHERSLGSLAEIRG